MGLFICLSFFPCILEYVQAHWKEDAFFGYQCLNGCNPLIIKQIHCFPTNLAVTSEMLTDFLPEGSSLEQELEVCVCV